MVEARGVFLAATSIFSATLLSQSRSLGQLVSTQSDFIRMARNIAPAKVSNIVRHAVT